MPRTRFCLLALCLLPLLATLPTAHAEEDPCAAVPRLKTEASPANTTLQARPMIILRIHGFPAACDLSKITMSIDGYFVDHHEQRVRGALEIVFWHRDQDVSPGQHTVQVKLFHEDRLVRTVQWGFGYLLPSHDSPLYDETWTGVDHGTRPPSVAGHSIAYEGEARVYANLMLNAYAPDWIRPNEPVASASLRVERTHFLVVDGERHDLPPLEAQFAARVDMPCGELACRNLLP